MVVPLVLIGSRSLISHAQGLAMIRLDNCIEPKKKHCQDILSPIRKTKNSRTLSLKMKEVDQYEGT